MRIAICDSYYGGAIDALYGGRPGLADAAYPDQLAAVMELSLGTGDAYSHGLRSLGHEASELVVNATSIQREWAAEHHTARAAAPTSRLPGLVGRAAAQLLLHQVAHAQLEAMRPDVVFVQDLSFFTRRELRRLKRPGLLLVGQLGVDPPADGRITEFDLVVSSLPRQVERLRSAGQAAEYFAIGFDDRVLEKLAAEGIDTGPEAERDIPVAFVGGINADVHGPGTQRLAALAEEADVQFWGYVHGDLPAPIAERHHGEAWGMEMYRILARSRLALNRHSRVAEGMANNMRLFEATGVGSCLITEQAPNLTDLFVPGVEVATYRETDDLVSTVRELSADHDRRLAIAAAGRARTLRDHTYTQRMAELADILARHAS